MEDLNRSTGSEDTYLVERIVDSRIKGGRVQYLVKWVGYPDSDNTWESEENCEGSRNLIREFEAERRRIPQENRIRRASRGRRPGRPSNQARTHSRTPRRGTSASHDLDNARVQLENLSFCASDDVPLIQDESTSILVSSVCVPPIERIDDSVPSATNNGTEERPLSCSSSSRAEQLRSISPQNVENVPQNVENLPQNVENVRYVPRNERSINDIRSYTEEQLEIVGAEPVQEGVMRIITVGIRVVNDDEVYRFSTEEVVNRWPHLLVRFYERHIKFDEN